MLEICVMLDVQAYKIVQSFDLECNRPCGFVEVAAKDGVVGGIHG